MQEKIISDQSTVIPITQRDPAVIFTKKGTDDILGRAREWAKCTSFDTSSPKGRAAIKSTAFQISKSKTTLDNLGKKLVEDEKRKIKLVDAERKRIRDGLDAIRDEVRAPLTQWEETEKQRIAAQEENISKLKNLCLGLENLSSAELLRRKDIAEGFNDFNWDEDFILPGTQAYSEAISLLSQAHEIRVLKEEEELRKKKEAEILQQREEAERKAAEAEERAKLAEKKAEEARKAATLRIEEEKRLAEEREAARKLEIEREKKRESERIKQERIRAEEEKIRIEKAKEEAVEAERRRIAEEAESLRIKQEEEKANKKLIEQKESSLIQDLVEEASLSSDDASSVLAAVKEQRIIGMVIDYSVID